MSRTRPILYLRAERRFPETLNEQTNVRADRWPGDTVFSSPYDNSSDIGVYCKAEIVALWKMVAKYFG